MTLKQLAGMGRKLCAYLRQFADCFGRREARELFRVYIQGQLADVPRRKTAEGIALQQGKAPRTVQRLLESIKWDEEKLHDRSQEMIAQEHAHPQAIGVVDESAVAKSGTQTAGVGRQWNGNRGKVDNCVVGVHLAYAAPGFRCLLGSRLYLPEDWTNDPLRRVQAYVPEEVSFQTKPQIALELIARALGNGVRVAAWTFDELYGRDAKFLDGLQGQQQAFVGEVPADFHGWLQKPKILHRGPKNCKKRGRGKKYPRLARRSPSREVRNLVKYSPEFCQKGWQRYRIKDTTKGPQVWEGKWAVFWRKSEGGLPRRRHVLIAARNVLTGEMKYFVANRVPGEKGFSLRRLLEVAFGRWSVEQCFREAKDELGLDHYQVRGWRCVHRHFYLTQLSHLFCARVRQEYEDLDAPEGGRLSVEDVRRAMSASLEAAALTRAKRTERYEAELEKQRGQQRRRQQACRSHRQTRIDRFRAQGIDVDRIKSCKAKQTTDAPRKPPPSPRAFHTNILA